MAEQPDIIAQLNSEIAHAIRSQNATALQYHLAEFTKAHKTFDIFEFYRIIKIVIFQYTNGDFLAHKPISKANMIALRWLEITLKDSPYQLSIMLIKGHIALYNNQLDKASKLYRQSLMLYINFIKKNKLSLSSEFAWRSMLRFAVLVEPAEAEGQAYPLPPLQLPESLINKAPKTIITAYGNAPYIQKCATRLTRAISELMPEVEILLVVGNESKDRDAETEQTITRLQQQFPNLHVADETIPQVFQQKNLLYTYCTARRFTYLQDIITQSKCEQLITIDIDLHLQPIFKRYVEYVTDAPIGYTLRTDKIFFSESVFIAPFLKVNNSAISKKYCAKIYDYLAKKFTSNHLLWVVDEYALIHAWQTVLTPEEHKQCRNITDLDTDEYHLEHFHHGFTADEQALFQQEQGEKDEEFRFKSIVMPQHVSFDAQTLRPILNLDWDV